MTELKPCPFCGVPMNYYNGILFAFHKTDCFFQYLEEHEVDLSEDEILDGFINAWNRRAKDDKR